VSLQSPVGGVLGGCVGGGGDCGGCVCGGCVGGAGVWGGCVSGDRVPIGDKRIHLNTGYSRDYDQMSYHI
jgi:hypothetical protein